MTQLPVKIKIGGTGVTITTSIDKGDKLKKAAAITPDKEAEELELRLIALDDNDEDKTIELNVAVLAYAEKLLRGERRKELLAFLNSNKHRFNPDLKDWLADTIRSFTGNAV